MWLSLMVCATKAVSLEKKKMQNLTEYRNQILKALLSAVDDDGRRRVSDDEAAKLSKEFSDEELAFGIDYNTPEEVAEMLLDAGL